VDNLKLMKETISALPQFQEMKQKYSIHINVCQECKTLFEKRKLDAVAAFEQDISTGLTVEGKQPRNAMIDLVPLLLDNAIS
jgi:syntaxin-binding protein 1